MTDRWTGEASRITGEQALTLAPRETLLFRASGTRMLANGYYLSELPGRINPAVDGVTGYQAERVIYRAILPWNSSRGTSEHPRYGGGGRAPADATPNAGRLAVAGRRFATGLGVLANSRLKVRNEGFARFSAEIGVDDSARDRSQPVTFAVYGDGQLLARSVPMRFGEQPARLEADVAGVALVELVAGTPEPMRSPDPVVWGEAAFTRPAPR